MEVPHYPPTGFPSPAEEWIEPSLKIENLLIFHPSTTFFIRVVGDAMVGAGIHEGDIVVVDCALEPADQRVIVAILGDTCTIKRRDKLKCSRLALLHKWTRVKSAWIYATLTRVFGQKKWASNWIPVCTFFR
jgi:hypothetical protein